MIKILTSALLWGLCAVLWLLVAVDRADSSDTLVSVKDTGVTPAIHHSEPESAASKPDHSGMRKPASSECININSATVNELTALPGVGPVIAGRIAEYRDKHGPFKRLTDVDRVKGIGPVKLKKLEGRICF